MKKLNAAIRFGYNTLCVFNIAAVIFAISTENLAEALTLAGLGFVITTNSGDMPRRMLHGSRASLPGNPPIGQLTKYDNCTITGSFFMSLSFYLGWAIISIAVAKNIIASILFIIQAKLITEQHREVANPYVVAVSHTLPPVAFQLLLPEGMLLAKVVATCGSVLLFFQSTAAISTLKTEGLLQPRLKRNQ